MDNTLYQENKIKQEILSFRPLKWITSIKTSSNEIRIKREATKLQVSLPELHGSIRYAKRIQEALMHKEKHLHRLFPDSFLNYWPKDIVSGDFYWLTKHADKSGKILIALADCTGHGIPGAFMSILGINLLNQIVLEDHNYEPSSILQRLDYKLKKSFSQVSDSENHETYDGMDISICSIDYANNKLVFAGAFMQMVLISQEGLAEYKGSRYPIGGLNLEDKRSYDSIEINFKPGDNLYFFTDGYSDQFGGLFNKKFKTKTFKSLLLKIHKHSMQTQAHEIKRTFLEWKGNKDQTDDITVMGIRL